MTRRAEREDRTLLGLLVGQVSSPEGELRGTVPEEGLEPPPQRFKGARPRRWTTPDLGCGGRIRTDGFLVMSQASGLCSSPQ